MRYALAVFVLILYTTLVTISVLVYRRRRLDGDQASMLGLVANLIVWGFALLAVLW